MVSQLSTALTPVVAVTLNGPGLMVGPTDRGTNTHTQTDRKKLDIFLHCNVISFLFNIYTLRNVLTVHS